MDVAALCTGDLADTDRALSEKLCAKESEQRCGGDRLQGSCTMSCWTCPRT